MVLYIILMKFITTDGSWNMFWMITMKLLRIS